MRNIIEEKANERLEELGYVKIIQKVIEENITKEIIEVEVKKLLPKFVKDNVEYYMGECGDMGHLIYPMLKTIINNKLSELK
jgi:ribosomal protein S3AE